MVETISIRVSDLSFKKEVVKLVRRFGSYSNKEIIEAMRLGKSIYEKKIDNEKFYSGIYEIQDLISLFEKQNIPYILYSNNVEIEKSYIDSILKQIENLRLEDFR